MPTDTSMSQVGIAIPKNLIEDIVRAAVVRELGNQEALIEGIVTAALKEKDTKSYRSDETIFMSTVRTMIREVAQEAVREWVDTNREKIKAAFIKHLNSRDGQAIKKLVDGMVDGVSKYNVGVKFTWGE